MIAYRNFSQELTEIAREYQLKLSQVRKDNLLLNGLRKDVHANIEPKHLNNLRALNRAPLIDKSREVLKVLSYFHQKFTTYSLEYRLEEYNSEPNTFVSTQKSCDFNSRADSALNTLDSISNKL